LPPNPARGNTPVARREFETLKILRHRLEFATSAPIEFRDVTQAVRDWVATTGIRNGLLTLLSPHTTARVNINESEVQLQRDMTTFLKRMVPRDGDWLHNIDTVDDRDNAHSHLLGLFMAASETIPVADGALILGEWQSIFFVELDGPRPRRLLDLHIMGEA
jgi:secondary thiamine-phosphate synthase enzyme